LLIKCLKMMVVNTRDMLVEEVEEVEGDEEVVEAVEVEGAEEGEEMEEEEEAMEGDEEGAEVEEVEEEGIAHNLVEYLGIKVRQFLHAHRHKYMSFGVLLHGMKSKQEQLHLSTLLKLSIC